MNAVTKKHGPHDAQSPNQCTRSFNKKTNKNALSRSARLFSAANLSSAVMRLRTASKVSLPTMPRSVSNDLKAATHSCLDFEFQFTFGLEGSAAAAAAAAEAAADAFLICVADC